MSAPSRLDAFAEKLDAIPFQEGPAPGLHPGVPYQVYDRWPAIRYSYLRHFQHSAQRAYYKMTHPESGESLDMVFGNASHKAILEPERFEKEYGRSDQRLTPGKGPWVKFVAANNFKLPLSEEDYDACIAMRDAVWSHPTAGDLLRSPGQNEISALWMDKEFGLPCKGRQDRFGLYQGWPTVIDLKSARDATRRAFGKAINEYGYHEQAAMYLDGFETLAPVNADRRYVFIVVEKEAPFCVAVYELEAESIEVGRKRYRRHLRQYAACRESGVYGGLGDGMDLISLPSWAMTQDEEL